MTHFALIGRPTLIFTVTRLFFLLDTIPCVRGRTADGKRETCARLKDVLDRTGAPR